MLRDLAEAPQMACVCGGGATPLLHDLSSLIQGLNLVTTVKAMSPNHCTIRELPPDACRHTPVGLLLFSYCLDKPPLSA